ncbi:hypothetical protein [Planctomicrobium piriforme]|uniref:hypothetical protein n=1 Tax=Planctomicrobium piriforme TaxID=1576369 RepID=UPI001587AB65|nr:hypothetical protein [Planctomicrobium piriforme]
MSFKPIARTQEQEFLMSCESTRRAKRHPVMILQVHLCLSFFCCQAIAEAAEPVANQADTTKLATTAQVTRLLSPDDRHIAYGQIAIGPESKRIVRIIVGNSNGDQRRPLTLSSENVLDVQWHGNDRIAYVTEHGQDGYSLIDMNGAPAGAIAIPRGCDSIHHQCLSPDGRLLAFCGNDYGEIPADVDRKKFIAGLPKEKVRHGVFVVNLAEQTVKQLLTQTVANLPAWSPDSRFLAAGIGQYVKDYPLAIIDVITGEVSRPAVQGAGVAWSPDGTALTMTTDIAKGGSWYGGIPLDGALGLWDIKAQQLQRLSPPGSHSIVKEPYSRIIGGSLHPVWARDGRRIAFEMRESQATKSDQQPAERREMWVVRRDGTELRKILNHGVDQLAWGANDTELLWVVDGRFGRTNLELDTVGLGLSPFTPTGQYIIHGHITDGAGKPLPGVEVTVMQGVATLFPAFAVQTDARGKYEIALNHLSTGAHAMLRVRMDGYFEQTLAKKSFVRVADGSGDRPPEDNETTLVVSPQKPYRLDFTMLPAAAARVQILDVSGNPLSNFNIFMDGEELYPACIVLAQQTTDANGNAQFNNIPLKEYYFSLRSGRQEIKSTLFNFQTPEAVDLRLTYNDLDGTLSF